MQSHPCPDQAPYRKANARMPKMHVTDTIKCIVLSQIIRGFTDAAGLAAPVRPARGRASPCTPSTPACGPRTRSSCPGWAAPHAPHMGALLPAPQQLKAPLQDLRDHVVRVCTLQIFSCSAFGRPAGMEGAKYVLVDASLL